MIRIRVDDVMVDSGAFSKERATKRVQQIHRWLQQQPNTFTHIPTVLVTEIQGYPEIVSWLREEADAGRLAPQLHGFEHVDYNKLPLNEIEDHLDQSITWFRDNLGIEPTIWATPWGADGENIRAAARKFVLNVETTQRIIMPGTALRYAEHYNSIKPLDGVTVLAHWWERGLKLLRLVEVANHGSWTAAKTARPDLF